ncbi:hypothetical protein L9F63_028217, partial [Diploptera punctata]
NQLTNAVINEDRYVDTRDSESQRCVESSNLSSRDRRLHLGKVIVDDKAGDELGSPCTTPDGHTGTCDSLVNCPRVLLDSRNLRQSACYTSFFALSVCCP